jgi:hypothetical protein
VLAGGQRPLAPLPVEAVGKRDVDGVDVGVGEQLLVAGIGPALWEKRPRPLRVATGDADQLGAGGRLERRDERLAGDPGGAKDPEPQPAGIRRRR